MPEISWSEWCHRFYESGAMDVPDEVLRVLGDIAVFSESGYLPAQIVLAIANKRGAWLTTDDVRSVLAVDAAWLDHYATEGLSDVA